MSKLYHGSCICGAIKYETPIDFSKGTGKCNCTICGKLRYWGIKVTPPSAFKLLTSWDDISDYNMNTDKVHNYFCKKCGTHAFHGGDVPEVGGEFVTVNIACLDDVDDEEKAAFTVRYADGKANNWWNEPKVTKHL
jgi:hypothetical protein